MAKTHEKLLLEHFPDATYIASGLDAGKWETPDYKFHLRAGFYTSKTTGKTCFVNGKNGWEETLVLLKQISDKYKDSDHIGKG